jgi:enoyl-CoA hydratase/carnithine racemase
MTPAAEAILACDRPIIAAVNGVAVGWGMDLSLLADMRVASTEARFASLFVKRGLITDLGGLWRLPKLVGPERAAELIFSGRMIDGAEAAALGMVLEVVPADELMTRAQALAMSIAENPPLAVRYLKEGLRRSTWSDPEPMGSWISQTLGVLFATEDHREGVASFLEKRPPKFTGR